jgi:hypothetical protein
MSGSQRRLGEVVIVSKVHTEIDQLILDTKDLSRFSIARLKDENCWIVCDEQTGDLRKYRTKFNAQQAICAVVKATMEVK